MVETRYSGTACLLAESGVGVAVVDSFAVVGGRYDLVFRPLTPRVPIEAFALTARGRPQKRLVRAFLDEVRRSACASPIRFAIRRDGGAKGPHGCPAAPAL